MLESSQWLSFFLMMKGVQKLDGPLRARWLGASKFSIIISPSWELGRSCLRAESSRSQTCSCSRLGNTGHGGQREGTEGFAGCTLLAGDLGLAL